MKLLPIKTPLLKEGDDLSAILLEHGNIQNGDIVAVSSKAFSMVEGNLIDLSKVDVTDEGRMWSERCGRTPEFRQAVINEAARLGGSVVGSCPQATLTEVRPEGLSTGSILIANAGLDESNCENGFAIGWPEDSLESIKNLNNNFVQNYGLSVGLLMTDSCMRPRRLGLSAMAMTVCNFQPLQNERGKSDLFGRTLKITHEATADQIATATNMLMGNADQCIPAVIVRDHGITLNDFCGWVPGIEVEEDLFCGAM